jgi:hypothetical protein
VHDRGLVDEVALSKEAGESRAVVGMTTAKQMEGGISPRRNLPQKRRLYG